MKLTCAQAPVTKRERFHESGSMQLSQGLAWMA